MALVTNFFAEFRQLLHFIKNKVQTVFNTLEGLSNQLENSIETLSSNLNKPSEKIDNFNIFLIDKLTQVKISLSKTIDNKTEQIKNLLYFIFLTHPPTPS